MLDPFRAAQGNALQAAANPNQTQPPVPQTALDSVASRLDELCGAYRNNVVRLSGLLDRAHGAASDKEAQGNRPNGVLGVIGVIGEKIEILDKLCADQVALLDRLEKIV
jgi:hypothetical protein